MIENQYKVGDVVYGLVPFATLHGVEHSVVSITESSIELMPLRNEACVREFLLEEVELYSSRKEMYEEETYKLNRSREYLVQSKKKFIKSLKALPKSMLDQDCVDEHLSNIDEMIESVDEILDYLYTFHKGF